MGVDGNFLHPNAFSPTISHCLLGLRAPARRSERAFGPDFSLLSIVYSLQLRSGQP